MVTPTITKLPDTEQNVNNGQIYTNQKQTKENKTLMNFSHEFKKNLKATAQKMHLHVKVLIWVSNFYIIGQLNQNSIQTNNVPVSTISLRKFSNSVCVCVCVCVCVRERER